MSKLPDKPSELIRVALADLRKCEEDPCYEINMAEWHAPHGGRCEVCLAGSVMAQSLGADPDCSHSPKQFSEGAFNLKLCALDEFHEGCLAEGLDMMGLKIPDGLEDEPVPEHLHGPAAFHTAMLRVASILEEAGL